jgi:excisionase family DNA binding protein
MDEWLTTKQACEYLKVHRRTLYRMMEDGRLPYRSIVRSRRRRIRKEDLDALLVLGESGPPRPSTRSARGG